MSPGQFPNMKVKPHLVAGIINYQDYNCLYSCLKSLNQQTLTVNEVILIDNASTPEKIRPIAEVYPEISILAQEANLGYTGGANRIIRSTGVCDYILLLNPDVVLLPEALEEMIRIMETDSEIGCVGGKLLLGLPPEMGLGSGNDPTVDSAGHIIHKNRRVFERGHGERDNGQYDKEEEVFSVCGAAALYRRVMLEDVKIGEEYFDEDFFAYKEDVDISWRARLLGWKTVYTPKARLYHLKGWKHAAIRKNVPWIRRYHSFKNHYLVLIKNELSSLFLQDLLQITWLEWRKLAYMTLFEPTLWRAIWDIRRYWASAWRKRQEIMKKVRITDEEMARWFL